MDESWIIIMDPSRFMMIHSLKLTFSPLQMDAWNTFSFPIGVPAYFQGRFAVSFREGIISYPFVRVWSRWSWVLLFYGRDSALVKGATWFLLFSLGFKNIPGSSNSTRISWWTHFVTPMENLNVTLSWAVLSDEQMSIRYPFFPH